MNKTKIESIHRKVMQYFGFLIDLGFGFKKSITIQRFSEIGRLYSIQKIVSWKSIATEMK